MEVLDPVVDGLRGARMRAGDVGIMDELVDQGMR